MGNTAGDARVALDTNEIWVWTGVLWTTGGAAEDHKVAVTGADVVPGFLGAKLVQGTNVVLTLLNPGGNEQIQINASGASLGVPFAAAYYDGAGVPGSVAQYLADKPDSFQRPGVHDFRVGGTSRGAVYRLGAWSQDGDPVDVTSEGYITYGANALGAGPNATDGALGFYEPNGFGVYNVIPGVNGGNTFMLCGFEDGSVNAPFGYQGFQVNDNANAPLFHVDRTGPNAGFVFIGQSGRDNGSSAHVQSASTVANAAQYRSSQYGANTGAPGISTFKSRGATVGALVAVLPGDVLFRATCVGVSNTLTIPLAGFITIQVPTNFVPAGQAWVPSEYELQLVPLAGPINSRRVVFKVSSEGETQTLSGVRVGGPNTTPATIATAGALLRSGIGSPEGVIVGSVGDLWCRRDGVPNDTLYVKESGAATNVGWTPVRQTLRGATPFAWPVAAIGDTIGLTVTVPGALAGMCVAASVDPSNGTNQWVLYSSTVSAPNTVELHYVCLTGAAAIVNADVNVAVFQ